MKFCLVGGHLTPALAFARLAKTKGHALVFIGRDRTSAVSGQLSQESRQTADLHSQFYTLKAPKIETYRLVSILKLYQLIPAYRQALAILKREKPSVVIGFGSYLAFPVAVAAKTLHLPLLIHEQALIPGLTNRSLALFADQICVAWPQTVSYFSGKKVEVVGNPLREEFYRPQLSRPAWLPASSRPLLYVTGGNQGSSQVNNLVKALYVSLADRFQIVHQCGGFGQNRAQSLQSAALSHLYVKEWLEANEAAWCLSHAALVISRSGANTVSEIIHCRVPAILIPLLQARFQEQLHNARLIADAGGGEILSGNEPTPAELLALIEKMLSHLSHYRQNLDRLGLTMPKNPALSLFLSAQNLASDTL